MSRFPIDTLWFIKKCKEKGLSQRKMGLLLDIKHEALSRLFRGHTPLRLDQATKLAKYFDVSLYELLRRAGTDLPPPEGMALPVVGSVNGMLHVTPGKHPPVASMPIFERAAVGLICDDHDSLFYGWIFVYVPAEDIQSSAIGRLSVVQLASGQRLIRFLKPGLHADQFNLVPFSGRSFLNVDDVCAATPVLHIRPTQGA
jgi:hypothetical protein